MSKLLTENEYVDEHRDLLNRLHLHDGVWWSQAFPGYSKPAFQFHVMAPGSAQPARLKSVLGYRHHVPEVAMGNQVVDYMILEGEDLRQFGLGRLDGKTRNLVRSGLKRCDVREMSELEPYLENAREVCISHSKRLAGYRESYHVSHTYFIEQADSWQAQMRRDFRSGGRTWWGAFVGNRLVGYMVVLQVESTMIVEKVKIHIDAIALHASDALYFTALDAAGRDQTCLRIFNSRPQREGLDRFKRHYLFKPTPVPFYVSSLGLYQFTMRVLRIRNRLMLRLRAARRNGLEAAGGRADTFAPAADPGVGESAPSPRTNDPVGRVVP